VSLPAHAFGIDADAMRASGRKASALATLRCILDVSSQPNTQCG
jgi:hypothetical protein